MRALIILFLGIEGHPRRAALRFLIVWTIPPTAAQASEPYTMREVKGTSSQYLNPEDRL